MVSGAFPFDRSLSSTAGGARTIGRILPDNLFDHLGKSLGVGEEVLFVIVRAVNLDGRHEEHLITSVGHTGHEGRDDGGAAAHGEYGQARPVQAGLPKKFTKTPSRTDTF